MGSVRGVLIWTAVAAAIAIPLVFAVISPLLQWRDPVYILAGFAGVLAMALLLLQPLLVAGALPGARGILGRRVHRFGGAMLVILVITHVAGLWITSPPDVVDALLFRSPAPFSAWGVIAMWAVFAAAIIGLLRKRMGARLRVWRLVHTSLVCVVVVSTVVHAVQIEGTMEQISKSVLACIVVIVLGWVILSRRTWTLLPFVRRA